MLFEGGGRKPPPNFNDIYTMSINKNPYTMRTKDVVEMILSKADDFELRSEVRSEAMAILKENPNIDTGSAYLMAAIEWDVA